MPYGDINLLAVIVAAIIKMALGAIWYSPKVFGEIWANSALGKGVTEVKATPWHYAAEAALSLLMALVLALFVNWMGLNTVSQALTVAFFLWLGFIATTQLCGVIWGKVPVNVYLVHTGFILLSLLIMTTLITVWV